METRKRVKEEEGPGEKTAKRFKSDPTLEPSSTSLDVRKALSLQRKISELVDELNNLQKKFDVGAKQALEQNGESEKPESHSFVISRESIYQTKKPTKPIDTWVANRLHLCNELLNEFMKHELAKSFLEPNEPLLDNSTLPQFPFLQSPTDLSTILKHLQNGTYECAESFASDMRRVWAFALFYNEPDSQIYKSAAKLSNLFEITYQRLFVEKTSVTSIFKYSDIEFGGQTGTPPSPPGELVSLPAYLHKDLFKFLHQIGEHEKSLVAQIIQEEMPILFEGQEDQVVIDLGSLSGSLLFRLHIFHQNSLETKVKEKPKPQNPTTDNEATVPMDSKERNAALKKSTSGGSQLINLNVVTMTNLNLNDMANMTNLPVIYPSGNMPGLLHPDPPKTSLSNSRDSNVPNQSKSKATQLSINVSKRQPPQLAIRSPRAQMSPRSQDSSWGTGLQHDAGPNWTNPSEIRSRASPVVSPRNAIPSEPNWSAATAALAARTNSPAVSPRGIPSDPWGSQPQSDPWGTRRPVLPTRPPQDQWGAPGYPRPHSDNPWPHDTNWIPGRDLMRDNPDLTQPEWSNSRPVIDPWQANQSAMRGPERVQPQASMWPGQPDCPPNPHVSQQPPHPSQQAHPSMQPAWNPTTRDMTRDMTRQAAPQSRDPRAATPDPWAAAQTPPAQHPHGRLSPWGPAPPDPWTAPTGQAPQPANQQGPSATWINSVQDSNWPPLSPNSQQQEQVARELWSPSTPSADEDSEGHTLPPSNPTDIGSDWMS